ncbi:DUF72 domain-containing protein [Marmoricola sp. RAF53]|uniref:DUF72 domain-containing protein n=1 Tax=Marmoricola sp. RAF53 TaxID=3233059 RepID=UPI003F9C774A
MKDRRTNAGRARVGISGWQYPGWRGDFYPTGLPHAAELTYAAERFTTIELNGSFYSLQRPSSYRRWRDATPEDFVFAVKGGRYITHLKRLRGIETALANFYASGVLLLGPKLGPFLWQLPELVQYDEDVLDGFLGQLPRSTAEAAELASRHDAKARYTDYDAPASGMPLRHALEVRHSSFDTPGFYELLRRHGVACVVADTAARWPQLDVETAPFDYVRLHGHSELYASRYADRTLERWATRCRRATSAGRDIYVYFDNDARGHAPHDATRLAAMLTAT